MQKRRLEEAAEVAKAEAVDGCGGVTMLMVPLCVVVGVGNKDGLKATHAESVAKVHAIDNSRFMVYCQV